MFLTMKSFAAADGSRMIRVYVLALKRVQKPSKEGKVYRREFFLVFHAKKKKENVLVHFFTIFSSFARHIQALRFDRDKGNFHN